MLSGVSAIAQVINKILVLIEKLIRKLKHEKKKETLNNARKNPYSAFISHFSDGMCDNGDADETCQATAEDTKE